MGPSFSPDSSVNSSGGLANVKVCVCVVFVCVISFFASRKEKGFVYFFADVFRAWSMSAIMSSGSSSPIESRT